MESVDLFAEIDRGSLCAAANLCSERGREKKVLSTWNTELKYLAFCFMLKMVELAFLKHVLSNW